MERHYQSHSRRAGNVAQYDKLRCDDLGHSEREGDGRLLLYYNHRYHRYQISAWHVILATMISIL